MSNNYKNFAFWLCIVFAVLNAFLTFVTHAVGLPTFNIHLISMVFFIISAFLNYTSTKDK